MPYGTIRSQWVNYSMITFSHFPPCSMAMTRSALCWSRRRCARTSGSVRWRAWTRTWSRLSSNCLKTSTWHWCCRIRSSLRSCSRTRTSWRCSREVSDTFLWFKCMFFMPPPLGAGGIMFSGCPSVRLSVRPSVRPSEAWNTLFWPVHGSVGPPDQP